MKYRLLACLFSLCAGLGLGGSKNAVPQNAGIFARGLLLTLNRFHTTSLSFTFIPATTSHYRITVGITNSLCDREQLVYELQDYPLNAYQSFYASAPIDPTVWKIAKTDNLVWVRVLELNYTRSWSGHCTIDAIHATGVYPASGEGGMKSGNQYVYFDSAKHLLSCGSEYAWSLPSGTQYNPVYNTVDYSAIWIHYVNPAFQSFGGDLTLRLYDHLDEFEVGTLVNTGQTRYRSFPVRFTPNKLGNTAYYQWTIMGNETYAVDRRNLHMKPLEEAGPNDFTSTNVYLPTGLAQVGVPYHFRLCLNEMGSAGDFILVNLTVERTKEHFGDCVHSDYCVVVGG
jgi:hypothetical protein